MHQSIAITFGASIICAAWDLGRDDRPLCTMSAMQLDQLLVLGRSPACLFHTRIQGMKPSLFTDMRKNQRMVALYVHTLRTCLLVRPGTHEAMTFQSLSSSVL